MSSNTDTINNGNRVVRDIKEILYDNYMPYAEMVIVDRAIPAIDGLKPSQRRILWTMHKMNAKHNSKTKSANVVGRTMEYHPHGDQSIYETLTNMADKQGGWNCPPISAKGNMGKIFSTSKPAAPRYTESGLSDIAEATYFDFCDSVKMVRNYDNTKDEPELLPVAYPTILTETTTGIAVGYATNIPSFNFYDIIDATTELLTGGKITHYSDIRPEFSTGGIVPYTEELARRIWQEGKGSIPIYAKYRIDGDTIVFDELPYGVKAENVIKQIDELRRKDRFASSNIISVKDGSGLNVFEIRVLTSGNVYDVLAFLFTKTSLKLDFNVNINVILDGKLKTLSALGVLKQWIDWRSKIVQTHFTKLYEQSLADIEFLMAYIAIVENVDKHKWFDLIMNDSEYNIKHYILQFVPKISDKVFAKVLDLKFKDFRPENIELNRKKLAEVIKNSEKYLGYKTDPKGYMVEELLDLKEKFRKAGWFVPKTTIDLSVLDLEYRKETSTKVKYIDTSPCNVYIDNDMFLYKVSKSTRMRGDNIAFKFDCNGNDVILIFAGDGEVYKIYLEDIVTGSTTKEYIPALFGLEDIDIYHMAVYKDDQTFVCVHQDGYITFVDTNDFKTGGRKTKRITKGYCPGDYIEFIPVPTEKLNDLTLHVVDFIDMAFSKPISEILKKSRIAKTKVFNAKKIHLCRAYIK